MDSPDSFRAGDSVSWTVSLSAFPASAGWSVSFRLLSQAGVAVDIETTPAGDDHAATLTAAATANWPAGNATLVCLATKGAERKTVGSKTVTILPDLAVIGTFDGRTQNQKALDDLEAALAAYAAAGQGHVGEYQVAGRVMKFRTVEEIEALIAHYRRAVLKERSVMALINGEPPPGRCYYRG